MGQEEEKSTIISDILLKGGQIDPNMAFIIIINTN